MSILGNIGSGLSGGTEQILTRYQADTSQLRREVRTASAEQKRHAQETLRKEEEKNKKLERQIATWKQVGAAIGAVGAVVASTFAIMEARNRALQAFAEDERHRIGALGADIDALSEAMNNAVSEADLLRFAAQATGGEFELTEKQLTTAAEAARIYALRTGKDTVEALNTMARALLEGNANALQQYGVNIKAATGSTEAFNAIMEHAAQTVEEGLSGSMLAATLALQDAEQRTSVWKNTLDGFSETWQKIFTSGTIRSVSRAGQQMQRNARLTREETEELEDDLKSLRKEAEGFQRGIDRLNRKLEQGRTISESRMAHFQRELSLRQEGIRATTEMLRENTEAWDEWAENIEQNITRVVRRSILQLRRQVGLLTDDDLIGTLAGPEFGPSTDLMLSPEEREARRRAREKEREEARKRAEERAKEIESLQSDIQKLEERLDPALRTTNQFLETQNLLNDAVDKNVISQERATRLLVEYGESLGLIREEAGHLAHGLRELADEFEIPALTRQIDPDAPPGLSESALLAQRRAEMEELQAERGQKLENLFGPLRDFNAYTEAFWALSEASTAAFDAWITGSQSIGSAFKGALAEVSRTLANELFLQSLKHSAYSLGHLAFGDARGAGQHAAAAAAFGAGAVAAGGVARALGAGAPSTSTTGGSPSPTPTGGGTSTRERERLVVVFSEGSLGGMSQREASSRIRGKIQNERFFRSE